MKWFELEIIIYGIIIYFAVIAFSFGVLLKLDYYTSRGSTRVTESLLYLIFFNFITIGLIQKGRDTLTEIRQKEITPVKATAKIANGIPYGIILKLDDCKRTSYQFDLEDTDQTKEFIKKVNDGYMVSKLKDASEILLVNGEDSVYYNIYY